MKEYLCCFSFLSTQQVEGSSVKTSCTVQQPCVTKPVHLGSEKLVEEGQSVGSYAVGYWSIPSLEEQIEEVQSVGSCSKVSIQWPLGRKPAHQGYDSTGSNCSLSKSADSVSVHTATSPTQVQHDRQQYSTVSTDQLTSITTEAVQCSSPANVRLRAYSVSSLESQISRPDPIGV